MSPYMIAVRELETREDRRKALIYASFCDLAQRAEMRLRRAVRKAFMAGQISADEFLAKARRIDAAVQRRYAAAMAVRA